MWDKIKEHAVAVVYSALIFITVFCIVILVNEFARKPEPISTVATPAAVVAHEAKTDVVPSAPIKVFKRSAVIKKKVMLPQAVVDNPKEQVLAASTVESSLHPQTITTLLNTDTGETTTYIKQEPLPWIAMNTHGELSSYIGVKNSIPTVRIQAKQNLIDVKSVHINAVGSVDQSTNGNTDFFVGVGATYTW